MLHAISIIIQVEIEIRLMVKLLELQSGGIEWDEK